MRLVVAMNSCYVVPDSVLRRVKELFDLVRPEMKLFDVIPLLRHHRAVIRALAVEHLDDVDHYVFGASDAGHLMRHQCLLPVRNELRVIPAHRAACRHCRVSRTLVLRYDVTLRCV